MLRVVLSSVFSIVWFKCKIKFASFSEKIPSSTPEEKDMTNKKKVFYFYETPASILFVVRISAPEFIPPVLL